MFLVLLCICAALMLLL
ncbi:hypothetical protein [Yersinia pestis]